MESTEAAVALEWSGGIGSTPFDNVKDEQNVQVSMNDRLANNRDRTTNGVDRFVKQREMRSSVPIALLRARGIKIGMGTIEPHAKHVLTSDGRP